MKLTRWKEVALAIAAAAIIVLVWIWLNARDARLKADATIDAQQNHIARINSRIESLEDVVKLAQQQAETAKRNVQTPQQVIRELPQYIPLPQPITLQQPAVDTSDELSDAPSAVIPQESLKPLFDFAVDCKACKASLDARTEEVAELKDKVKVVEQERDVLKKARGGFWPRAKWFVLGAAGGAAFGYVAHR